MSIADLRLHIQACVGVGELDESSSMDKPAIPRWNGSVLKALRESKRWSPQRLAEAVGCHKSQIYKWEDSENAPGADYLAAFSVLFGVGPMAFFVGVDGYQEFVVKHETGASTGDRELEEMAKSPLRGRQLRAMISAGRRGSAGAPRSQAADDRDGQPQPRRAGHAQTPDSAD
jgi:transcriptional regulator with XRE-family HTH domain